MTRPAHRHVLQTMRDLRGTRAGRRVSASADAELPAGVAARLALVYAGSRDHTVVAGDPARGTDDKLKVRAALLDEAVRECLTFDWCAPVSLPVRCGRLLHDVRLEEDGSLTARAHPGVDIASERVAASLGAPLLPCLQAIDNAHAVWEPPVADDGPRLVRIDVGELLAFVGQCRSWVRAGYPLVDAGAALDHGVSYPQVEAHLQLGMPVADAVAWLETAPELAVRWADIDFTPEDMTLWVRQRRTLKQAERAAAVAGDGRWLARWARIAGRQQSAEGLAEWAAFGVPVGVWGEAAARGFRARDVPAWTAAGFQPVEVLRYAHLRVPLHEAIAWRDAGFTAFVATGCLGVGLTLHAAQALRGLPTREVQEAWRSCGSVELVLEALST